MRLQWSGLLLGHAMQRAEAEDQVAAGDADNFAAGEEAREGVEGDAIAGVVEGGDDDEFVGNVKIGVAGGQTLVIEIDWRGDGESFDAERPAVEVLRGLNHAEILPGRHLVDILRGRLHDGALSGRQNARGEATAVAA